MTFSLCQSSAVCAFVLCVCVSCVLCVCVVCVVCAVRVVCAVFAVCAAPVGLERLSRAGERGSTTGSVKQGDMAEGKNVAKTAHPARCNRPYATFRILGGQTSFPSSLCLAAGPHCCSNFHGICTSSSTLELRQGCSQQVGKDFFFHRRNAQQLQCRVSFLTQARCFKAPNSREAAPSSGPGGFGLGLGFAGVLAGRPGRDHRDHVESFMQLQDPAATRLPGATCDSAEGLSDIAGRSRERVRA